MTRKEALAELIEDVIQDDWPSPHNCRLAGINHTLSEVAYNGSLDAAKALHEAVLPGWDYILTNAGEHGGESPGPMAAVGERDALERGDEPFKASTNILARAWLLAILKALDSMEKD